MVSFQCHACTDVVKKPKLDQHHARCHAGFDCIDCSVTFHTPSEYKSHTSCISEAEKYQKDLYKGPKNGRENGNDITNGNAYGGWGGRGGFQGRGRGSGRSGFQGRGGYQGGGRPRNEATGANDTPLGTPQRMSPVTTPIDDTPSKSKTKNATDTDAPAPLPIPDAGAASSPTKNGENGPASSSERSKKEKKHKDKKSKSKDPSGMVKGNESNVVEHAPVPPPPSPDEATGIVKKKDKKRKEAEGNQTIATEQSKVCINEQGKVDDSKVKRKKKKSKGDHSAGDPKTDTMTQAEGNDEKLENGAPIGDNSRIEAHEPEKIVDSKERKKKESKETVPDPKTQGENKESKESKKKEKKRKSEKILDEATAPPTESASTPLQNGDSEKKSKKRKREGGNTEDGDIALANADRKGTKKSSKDSHSTGATPAVAVAQDSSIISKEPSSGKKRKRLEKDKDAQIPQDGKKDQKKRKHKKEVSKSINE